MLSEGTTKERRGDANTSFMTFENDERKLMLILGPFLKMDAEVKRLLMKMLLELFLTLLLDTHASKKLDIFHIHML